MTRTTIEEDVGPEANGERLDRWLASRVPNVSRARLQRHIKEGAVLVDGRPPEKGAKHVVRRGERVWYREPAPEPSELIPEPIPLDVLFEDDHFLAINKAAGIVVHPSISHASGTLVNGVLHHVGRLNAGDPARPGVVHRLDQGTTGVIVFAKHEDAHARLGELFRRREVTKTYFALAWGTPKATRLTLDTLYGRDPRHRKKFTGRVREGKRAVTHYEVIKRCFRTSWLEVRIETGRTHQIRVHLAEHGHPLVGDPVYGRRRTIEDPQGAVVVFERPALHAAALSFRHPFTDAPLALEAPIPADLEDLVTRLRLK